MRAPHSLTINQHGNEDHRIGPNKRSPKSETSKRIEDLVLENTPLPASFDVAPIQPPYFREFTYFDCMGGLYVQSMNEEINARVMEKAVKDATPDYSIAQKAIEYAHDKYVLNQKISYPNVKNIVMYTGSNLLHIINHDKVDQLLFNDPSVMIKPHPIMTEEGLKIIARRYGFGRLIDPAESGMAYLNNAEIIHTPASSEIGLYAAFMKKPVYNIARLQYMPKLPYAPIYRLFKDGDVEHNYEVVIRAFSSNKSGIVMPWDNNPLERINEFSRLAMETREVFKSSWAWLGEIVPINVVK